MSTPSETCWTLIEAAARGDDGERARFCGRYVPVVERTLASRWRDPPASQEIGDATQEVMLECLRSGGALTRADRERPGGFRAFLFGVTRNVARRFEERMRRNAALRISSLGDPAQPADGPDLSRAFDRAWAEGIVHEAADRLRRWALERSPAARRRVEILELRFGQGMTEAAIGARLGLPGKRIEKDFAKVRAEFLAILRQVVAWNGVTPGADVDRECRDLLAMLAGPAAHA